MHVDIAGDVKPGFTRINWRLRIFRPSSQSELAQRGSPLLRIEDPAAQPEYHTRVVLAR